MLEKRVLVIDDKPTMLAICQATLEQSGHRVYTCPTGREGLSAFQEEEFDLALIDVRMHDIDGLTILGQIRSVDAGIVAVMIPGEPTYESAVAAVKQGAFDYLPKLFWLTDSDSIVPQDLPARLREDVQPAIDASLPYGEAKRVYLEPFEKGYPSRLLEDSEGNVSRAAEKAGLHRSSFQRLLKQQGVRSSDHRT